MRQHDPDSDELGLRSVLANSDCGNMRLPTCVDEVSGHCEVCRAFDMAPHAPVAGHSPVAMISEQFRADLLFRG